MGDWFVIAFVAGAIAVLLVAASRARTIAVCRVVGRKVHVERGALPPAVLYEIREVVSRAALARATIELRRENGGVRVVVRDVSDADRDAVEQRLRNAVGRFPLARFR